MAGSAAIFRIDTVGDTEVDARAAGQIIEFNGGTAPDATGRHLTTGFTMIRDLSPHPNPKRALTKWQDNLLGVMEVTVVGYFVDHDATQGPGTFFNWQKDPASGQIHLADGTNTRKSLQFDVMILRDLS